MKPDENVSLVLGLHPSSHGLAWTAFTNPFTVSNHGAYRAPRKNKSAGCLKKAAWLFARLTPEVVVLEAFDERSLRSKRIRKLCQEIVQLAAEQGLHVVIYGRDEVQDAFRIVEARTREEIAEAVTRHVAALAPYLPDKRQPWEGEDRRLSRLCAAALVLTHYHFEASQFFDDLRKAS